MSSSIAGTLPPFVKELSFVDRRQDALLYGGPGSRYLGIDRNVPLSRKLEVLGMDKKGKKNRDYNVKQRVVVLSDINDMGSVRGEASLSQLRGKTPFYVLIVPRSGPFKKTGISLSVGESNGATKTDIFETLLHKRYKSGSAKVYISTIKHEGRWRQLII